MLEERLKRIEDAYQILEQDRVARMVYEAREAEKRDQLTREKMAREEGMRKGRVDSLNDIRHAITQALVKRGLSQEQVIEMTELKMQEIMNILDGKNER